MKTDNLEKLTCDDCNHLEIQEDSPNFYWCKVHEREIFDPSRAGCHRRERYKFPHQIIDYVGVWYGHRWILNMSNM